MLKFTKMHGDYVYIYAINQNIENLLYLNGK